ncbi:hypothetical protein [Tardiphaga robiniae]|uniref:hypothetical protein n=1 Tax=Tardiphaga robiniae TaxID=943830 RepID=UPI000ADCF469|nr:hypothetical protein [Tardiphaga robiniae]
MARIGNARTIADIEYVIEPPSLGSDVTAWLAHGVSCSRDRHRFCGQAYSFSLEILELRCAAQPRQRWHVVIVSERWQFRDAKAEPRGSKSLRVIQGKAADVLSWMRRCRERKLASKTGNLTLLTGDFNSASPHDPEPEGFDTLATHHRVRYLADDLQTADRSVLAHLDAAGWIDLGHALDPAKTPTVPTAGFVGTEFATMRCDYLLASRALAARAVSYQVIRTSATDMASDHYPVVASFEVPQ